MTDTNGDRFNILTERERQVAFLIARGFCGYEIAAMLEISPKTYDTHRGHILKKLGFDNTVKLTRWMLKNNLASLDDNDEDVS